MFFSISLFMATYLMLKLGRYPPKKTSRATLKYWKLRARKLTLHLINVAEINAQQN